MKRKFAITVRSQDRTAAICTSLVVFGVRFECETLPGGEYYIQVDEANWKLLLDVGRDAMMLYRNSTVRP